MIILQVIGGFQWIDPFTNFGDISLVVLASSIIAVLGFLIATVFIHLYSKKFYVGETPKSWSMFFRGLLLVTLYQLLKVPFTYKWIYGDLFTVLFLIFQIVAISSLVYGLYLLKKEVSL